MIIEQTIEILPNRRLELELPSEFPIGRARVELTITPETREMTARGESAFGCFHHFADLSKIPGEKGAWARAVQEKHAKN